MTEKGVPQEFQGNQAGPSSLISLPLFLGQEFSSSALTPRPLAVKEWPLHLLGQRGHHGSMLYVPDQLRIFEDKGLCAFLNLFCLDFPEPSRSSHRILHPLEML